MCYLKLAPREAIHKDEIGWLEDWRWVVLRGLHTLACNDSGLGITTGGWTRRKPLVVFPVVVYTAFALAMVVWCMLPNTLRTWGRGVRHAFETRPLLRVAQLLQFTSYAYPNVCRTERRLGAGVTSAPEKIDPISWRLLYSIEGEGGKAIE